MRGAASRAAAWTCELSRDRSPAAPPWRPRRGSTIPGTGDPKRPPVTRLGGFPRTVLDNAPIVLDLATQIRSNKKGATCDRPLLHSEDVLVSTRVSPPSWSFAPLRRLQA
jgi:hypothetical protein